MDQKDRVLDRNEPLPGCGSNADHGDPRASEEDVVRNALIRSERPAARSPGVLRRGDGTDVDAAILNAARDWLGHSFSMLRTTIEGKQLLAPHRHQYADQVVIVLGDAGLLRFQFGVGAEEETDSVLDAPAGSYVLKPKGISHTFWNPGSTPVPYIELSTKTQFQDPVGATAEGDSAVATDAAAAASKYYTTFLEPFIPEIMRRHGLTSVKGLGGIGPVARDVGAPIATGLHPQAERAVPRVDTRRTRQSALAEAVEVRALRLRL